MTQKRYRQRPTGRQPSLPKASATLIVLSGLLLLLLALSGCSTTPIQPTPVIVEVPGPTRYIPIPAELTKPCTLSLTPPTTNGDLYRQWQQLQAELAVCNNDKAAIRQLTEE